MGARKSKMINNIHTTYLKGEKAFKKGEFITAKKHLLSVVNNDSNYYAAYLLLFEIADQNNSSLKKTVFEELKRLNPLLNIEYKAPKSNRKKITKKKKSDDSILTIPYIKLLVQQGKILQAKKSLKKILNTTKNKKRINEAKEILNALNNGKNAK
jgi:Tfp pilus assembly protein PilF